MYPQYVIYTLVKHNEPECAIQVLFHEVDRWLREGRFDWTDKFLEELDVKKLDTNLIVGVLSITLAAKNELTKREAYVKRAREYLVELCPDRVDRLLERLE